MYMFTKEDFKNQVNQAKIQVIIMDRLGFDITTCYHDLSKRDQRRFESEQNQFLNTPPFKTDEWEDELNALSSDVVREFMDEKKFNPSKYATETIGAPDLNCERIFRNDEEKTSFYENERIQKERYEERLKHKITNHQNEIAV